jgi:RNA polymerase sigma-70 factor (ECF subfamily)
MRLKSRMALIMDEGKKASISPEQIESGDPSILAEFLVEQHYPYLYRLAVSILEDEDEADDAAQETILRALSHWQDSPCREGQRSWLSAIAINHCRDRLRRRRTSQKVVQFLQVLHSNSKDPSVEELVDRNQSHSNLWETVQSLDEKHRLPVILRFMHGLSAAEIAKLLQINEGTVYSRLHYAMGKLRQSLSRSFEEGREQ